MTEAKARDMEEPEYRAGGAAEQLAHARPVVERWLTWSGLVPLPAFLVLHVGRELTLAFATDVSDVLRPAPGAFGTLVSVLLVWLPFAVHVGAAALLLLRGQVSARRADDVPALARSLSRLSSLPALAFLLYHAQLFTLPVWLGEAAAEDAGFRLLAELSSTTGGVPLSGALYLLGLLASATHAALGVHRGLVSERLLVRPETRRGSARACAIGGTLLFCAGAAAVIRVASGVLLR